MKSGITVTATGQAFVTPDQAIVNLSASAVRADAADAMTEVSRRIQALLGGLRQAGIEEGNVQTSDLSLWPETDRNGAPLGYRARNGVRITLTDVSRVGEIVASGLAALGEGAEMSGVSFGRRDVDAVEAVARSAAWKRAVSTASQLADQAGLTLGRPLSIEESNPMGPPRPLARMAMAEAVPIESGSFTVTVALTVRFAIVG